MKRKTTKTKRPMTTAERVRKHRRALRTVKPPKPSAAALRRRARWDEPGGLELALRRYWPRVFYAEFSDDHKDAIDRLHRTFLHGGASVVALPRGTGKSSIGKAGMCVAVCQGWRRYAVGISATARASEKLLQFVKSSLRTSKTLRADYPDLAAWVDAAENTAAKAKTLLLEDGTHAGFVWGTEELVLPAQPDAPWSGSVIEVRGITGAIRGMLQTTLSGEELRPDFAFIDDPQTKESAKSQGQIDDRHETIQADILCLAGPGTEIAAYCAVTVIAEDDLSSRMLDSEKSPEWTATRAGLVKAWPDAQETLWKEYGRIYHYADAPDREARKRLATAFYRTHRAEMDAGGMVMWDGYRRKGEISAMQAAQNLLLDRGRKTFFAEYMNEPISTDTSLYTLTPELIVTRISGRPRHQVPASATTIIASADINHYGIHWVLLGFDADQTGYIADYGRYPTHGPLVPKDATEDQIRRLVYQGIAELATHLDRLVIIRGDTPMPIGTFAIDGGYQLAMVCRAAANLAHRFTIVPARGYASHKYYAGRGLIGQPGHHLHINESRERHRYLAYDADYWHETAQRALLPPAGTPGGLTLYGDQPTLHTEIANQIAAEKLGDKAVGSAQTFYKWHATPGQWHDYGDALYQAYAAAAWRGILPAGDITIAPPPKPKRPTRRISKIPLR